MALAIGIDAGGTKIKGVLMNDKGRILKSYRRPTQVHKSGKKIAANIAEVINKLKINKPKKETIRGVGIGIPGFTLPNGKILRGSGALANMQGLNLKKELAKKIRLKIFIDNDANCFALAEQRHGAAKGCRHMIGVIIGTGVGTGIIIDSKIYLGAIGGAGEAGHAKLLVGTRIKDADSLIAGPCLIKRYEELSGKKAHTAAVILNKKDESAARIYKEFIFYTGLFFANLINTFNPEVIVVGGGVSNMPFYKDVKKETKKYALPALAGVCQIKKNALGDSSGVIGAAEIVFSNQKRGLDD